MGTKQVRLDEDVYAKIADEKQPDETFSETVERLITSWQLTEFDLGLDTDGLDQFTEAVADIEQTTAENVDETIEKVDTNEQRDR